jgi:hypothetical protein
MEPKEENNEKHKIINNTFYPHKLPFLRRGSWGEKQIKLK